VIRSRPFAYQPARQADDLAVTHGTTSNIRRFWWFRPFRIIDPQPWTVLQEHRQETQCLPKDRPPRCFSTRSAPISVRTQKDMRCIRNSLVRDRPVRAHSCFHNPDKTLPATNRDDPFHGGGGNCTRVPISTSICPTCGYDLVTNARPEMGREGAALHELVANWHSLTSSVRAKIVDLLRSG